MSAAAALCFLQHARLDLIAASALLRTSLVPAAMQSMHDVNVNVYCVQRVRLDTSARPAPRPPTSQVRRQRWRRQWRSVIDCCAALCCRSRSVGRSVCWSDGWSVCWLQRVRRAPTMRWSTNRARARASVSLLFALICVGGGGVGHKALHVQCVRRAHTRRRPLLRALVSAAEPRHHRRERSCCCCCCCCSLTNRMSCRLLLLRRQHASKPDRCWRRSTATAGARTHTHTHSHTNSHTHTHTR